MWPSNWLILRVVKIVVGFSLQNFVLKHKTFLSSSPSVLTAHFVLILLVTLSTFSVLVVSSVYLFLCMKM